MTTVIRATRVARKLHRCSWCHRAIMPGETYHRDTGLDCGEVATAKCCEHCSNAVQACLSDEGVTELWWEDYHEWLREFPVEWAGLVAGWRFPDGELMPPPFQPRCRQCRCLLPSGRYRWCERCDAERYARSRRQFESLADESRVAP